MATVLAADRLLALCLLLTIFSSQGTGQRLNSKQWLHNHCKAYQEDYAPLISSYLSRYSYGINVNDILGLTAPPGRSTSVVGDLRPVIFLVNNTIHYVDSKLASMEARGRFSAGFSTYFSPVIKRLLTEVDLPDMPIAFNPDDRPCNDEDVGGGPYFGYCNVPKLTSNLPFPDFWSPEALNCGSGCEPFTDSDQRQEQAIFLGRPTGWHKGGRRAVIEAGRRHPDYLYSGLTEYPDPGIVSAEDEQTFGTVEQQSTSKQVREHKYIVNVDGWCSSKRMKQLLASDSAILNVVGMEDQWFTPLLKPMKHYIPVRFEANDPDLDEGSELIRKIKWAQEHPEEVGRIVQHAKSFHGFYLSQRGEECYAVQLLEEYSSLLLDSWKLQDRAASSGSATF